MLFRDPDTQREKNLEGIHKRPSEKGGGEAGDLKPSHMFVCPGRKESEKENGAHSYHTDGCEVSCITWIEKDSGQVQKGLTDQTVMFQVVRSERGVDRTELE